MVAQKGVPPPARRLSTSRHVLRYRRLRDLDAKLEQLAMNARRAPQRIGKAHLANKITQVARDFAGDRGVRETSFSVSILDVSCHHPKVGRTFEVASLLKGCRSPTFTYLRGDRARVLEAISERIDLEQIAQCARVASPDATLQVDSPTLRPGGFKANSLDHD